MADGRFAYVILCHHMADQALRLAQTIRRLSPDAGVLLRHNRRGGYIDEAQAAAAGAELLVSELPTQWGGWTLVEATLEAFRHARDRFDADWYVLVSGQDYPVRRLSTWEAELLEGRSDAVIPGAPIAHGPIGLRPRTPEDWIVMRYTHHWRRLPPRGIVPRLPRQLVRVVRAVWYRHLYELQALVVLNELPRDNGWALGVRRRRVPWTPQVPVSKGEQWVALSRGAMEIACGPETAAWRRYFATTLIPDEAYFATVLGNHPRVRVRPARVSWLQWEDDASVPHPRTITPDSLPEATASGMAFARKFDEGLAPGVLDLLDTDVLGLGS